MNITKAPAPIFAVQNFENGSGALEPLPGANKRLLLRTLEIGSGSGQIAGLRSVATFAQHTNIVL